MSDNRANTPGATAGTGGFDDMHAQYLSCCNAALEEAAARFFQPGSKVSEAARYALFNGGKRVRGVLTLAVCDMLDGDGALAGVFSASIEMIHAFSLVHDDLPCIDDDDMRRGKPSAHIAFGEANALLAGDLLAVEAFEAAAGAAHGGPAALKAVGVLAGAAGARGMIYGQELDLRLENSGAGEEELVRMVRHKTGKLLCGAAQLGAAAAGAEWENSPALALYAENIGLVFQVIDDILNEISTEQTMGKPVGNDRQRGKTTFASVYGLEEARALARRLTDEAAGALRQAYGDKAAFLCAYAEKLVQRAF